MVKNRLSVLFSPINEFIQKEYASGVILLFCILAAMIVANSPLKDLYHHVWEIHFYIGWGDFILDKPLHHWINDGLMSIFFFVIGLELKREIMAGELSTWKSALLPIIAALGGMVIPALIYASINTNSGTISGWGIPMATDIAIALGLLSMAGKKIPVSVKIFLTALAVVDDLGAVLVIGLFYSSDIYPINLIYGFIFLFILFAGNILGIRSTLFYAIFGILGHWYFFQESGVHPTIAGVLAAFAIPARTKVNEQEYLGKMEGLIKRFRDEVPNNSSLTTPEQHTIIHKIKKISSHAETPLQDLEHALHPLVSFLVLPVFAFANSGVEIRLDALGEFINSVTIGIVAGLVLGKFIGILGFTWLAIKVKILSLPESVTWRHIIGVSLLAGVGFTMSLFITELAFNDPLLVEKSKYGILLASIISGVCGILILKNTALSKK